MSSARKAANANTDAGGTAKKGSARKGSERHGASPRKSESARRGIESGGGIFSGFAKRVSTIFRKADTSQENAASSGHHPHTFGEMPGDMGDTDSENEESEEEKHTDETVSSASQGEEYTAAEREPAGSEVEQVRLPEHMKERYVFLDMLHMSDEGSRVYVCLDALWKPARDDTDDYVQRSRIRHGIRGHMQVEMLDKEMRKADAEALGEDLALKTREEQMKVQLLTQKNKKKQSRRRCILKVWPKGARPKDVEKRWLEMQLELLGLERHPNLMLPRKILEDETNYYVDFDCVQVGCSLTTMILSDASMTERQVKKIAKDVLRGLDHLHSKNLVHRDIKPDNILLEWEDAEKLLAKNARLPKGYVSSKQGVKMWKPAANFRNSWTRHELSVHVRIIDFDTCSHWDPSMVPKEEEHHHHHHDHHRHHHHNRESSSGRNNSGRKDSGRASGRKASNSPGGSPSHRESKAIVVKHESSDTIARHSSRGLHHHKADVCGTPGFMPPEAYTRNAGPQGDLFGVGLIIYLMVRCDAPLHDTAVACLRGEPFAGCSSSKRRALAVATEKVLEALDFTCSPWNQLPLCRDLCRMLLHPKPITRGEDAGDIMKTSPWYRKKAALSAEAAHALQNIEKMMDPEQGDSDDDGFGKVKATGPGGTQLAQTYQERRGAISYGLREDTNQDSIESPNSPEMDVRRVESDDYMGRATTIASTGSQESPTVSARVTTSGRKADPSPRATLSGRKR